MTAPLGVILAGGQSRRMGGGDKALLQLQGQTLLAHVIARIGPQVASLAINANGPADRFAGYGLPVIADSVEGFAGPLAGVLAGLDWAAALGASHIVTVAADTPFFPCDLVSRLDQTALETGKPIILAATPNPEPGRARHPTFGRWPVSLREDLRAALAAGTRKVVAWTDPHGCGLCEFGTAPFDPFFNVNTPEDMEKARLILRDLPGEIACPEQDH